MNDRRKEKKFQMKIKLEAITIKCLRTVQRAIKSCERGKTLLIKCKSVITSLKPARVINHWASLGQPYRNHEEIAGMT
jgi:hypothetical protein